MRYLLLIPLFVLTLNSCDQNKPEHQTEVEKKTKTPKEPKPLEGYWILSNYIDSIVINKSIQKQTRNRMTWAAIVLKVTSDTVIHHGLIMDNKNLKRYFTEDSLATFTWTVTYKLSYDSEKDLIIGTQISQNGKFQDTVQYRFRRIKDSEKRLIQNIDNNRFWENLQANFTQFFIDSLISGTYTPIESTSKETLVLKKDGTIRGFKNYNEYHIHSYFGTSHPFHPEDVLIFRDTNFNPIPNTPPKTSNTYNWKFKGDTLILTEMLTTNYDKYFLGKKKYVFIKQRK